jgi:pimeloyl-ACP methyl ester carboxylesterase
MVFKASSLPANYQFQFNQEFEEVFIPSFDNKKLHGLLFTTKNPKGLIFYLHGNRGMLDSWGNNAAIYTNLGYDIFFLDYRGFGKSEGTIENEEQVFKDVTFAYAKLIKKYKENSVVIIGYSIGTGLATYLAANHHPKQLILQAPFYNFNEFSSGIVPFFPDFLRKFQFETNKNILKVKAPIAIFHGDEDGLIPLSNAIRLNKICKPTDKLITLKEEDHVGINDNSDFQERLKEILN